MNIIRIELRVVRMPLRTPFATSFGALDRKDAVLIAVFSDDLCGWGEVSAFPDPYYSYETVTTSMYVLRDYLAPLLLSNPDVSPLAAAELAERVRGHPMAKAALETALLDLEAQQAGVSLWQHLGGARTQVPVGISLGIERPVVELLCRVEHALELGYQRIKMKIAPGWDIDPVGDVRRAFGNEVTLSVDANGAYGPDDADLLRRLDDFGLQMIEQPLEHDDLEQHADLQARLVTPVCLDESIKTLADARRALAIGSCQVINIKPGRVGGLLRATAIHDLCRDVGVPVFCGGMLETGVGRAANLAMATLPNFTLPSDLSASDRYFDQDLVAPPFKLSDGGFIDRPSGLGIGVNVDVELIDAFTIEGADLTGGLPMAVHGAH